jgi:hypothetical protein
MVTQSSERHTDALTILGPSELAAEHQAIRSAVLQSYGTYPPGAESQSFGYLELAQSSMGSAGLKVPRDELAVIWDLVAAIDVSS